MHPNIKFTAEWSETINFLDVTVTLIEGVIETDIYVKPTDSHLQSSSRHPFHCQKGIPYVCIPLHAIYLCLLEDIIWGRTNFYIILAASFTPTYQI